MNDDFAFLVEIIYKNGAKVRYWFKSLEFKCNGGGLTNIEWITVADFANPLFLNIDDISSLHQISAKKIKDLKDPLDTRLDWEK